MSAFDCSNVDAVDFLECLDIDDFEIGDREIRFPCPFHDGVDRNCSMNVETTAFWCHVCKERGNAISFTSQILRISPLEAIRMLKQRYQPGGLNPDAISMVEVINKALNPEPEFEVPQPQLDDSLLDQFAVDWERAAAEGGNPATDYMLGRNFAWQDLLAWDFGYDRISDRITIPVRDENGVLIGFKARAYDGRQPKYIVLGDKPKKPVRYGWPCYFTSRVLFGAHDLPDELPEDSPLIVCEGELNAIAVSSRTGRYAVALNGSYFSDFHAKIIRKHAKRVILFLDDDEAGNSAVWGHKDAKGIHRPGIVERLSPFMAVDLALPCKYDAAEMDGYGINAVLNNAESSLLHSLRKRMEPAKI